MTTTLFDVTGSRVWDGVVDSTTIKRPLLLIAFESAPDQEFPYERRRYGTEWQVDVEGKIDLYLTPPEGEFGKECSRVAPPDVANGRPINPVGIIEYDLMEWATPLMHELIEQFRAEGDYRIVRAVGMYTGSFGPSHLLRDGVFYKRPK